MQSRLAMPRRAVEILCSRHSDILEFCLAAPALSQEILKVIQPLLTRTKRTTLIVSEPDWQPVLSTLEGPQSRLRLLSHDGITTVTGIILYRDQSATALIGPGSALEEHSYRSTVEMATVVEGLSSEPYFGELFEWFSQLAAFSLWPRAATEPIGQYCPTLFDLTWTWFRQYIQDTQVFASYKLVIIAILLTAPDGKRSLDECAERFHRFYMFLKSKEVWPERKTGNPPPLMLAPQTMTLRRVRQVLLKEPKRAFGNNGDPVVFQMMGMSPSIFLPRPLWHHATDSDKAMAFETVLKRLEAYFERYTGSSQFVRQATCEATT